MINKNLKTFYGNIIEVTKMSINIIQPGIQCKNLKFLLYNKSILIYIIHKWSNLCHIKICVR
jgi:hypothetical protein